MNWLCGSKQGHTFFFGQGCVYLACSPSLGNAIHVAKTTYVLPRLHMCVHFSFHYTPPTRPLFSFLNPSIYSISLYSPYLPPPSPLGKHTGCACSEPHGHVCPTAGSGAKQPTWTQTGKVRQTAAETAFRAIYTPLRPCCSLPQAVCAAVAC